MEKIDEETICNELIEGVIRYRLDNHSMPLKTETEESICEHYRSDPVFNDKVKQLSSGIMSMISKYL